MTYAECYMLKQAKTEPSFYEAFAKGLAAGDPTITSAASTPTGQEIFWNLASAGLGAGGAYLLSRRLRRNGTKRQRAIDMVLGAIAGIGGAQLLFNMTGDEKSGLSISQTLRADRFGRESGKGSDDNSKSRESLSPFELNDRTVGGAVIGGASGAILGGIGGPGAELAETYARNRQLAKVNKEVKKMGLTGEGAAKHIDTYMNGPKGKGNIVGRRARFWGNVADVIGGGGLGALLGFGIGAAGNSYAAQQHELHGGGMN